MSAGIGVAGLVLATFPIVVYSVSHYVEGLETIRRWRQFRRELRSYSIAFETQSIWYLDTLEELLDGVVGSRHQLATMLANPEDSLWHKPEYEDRLRRRLDRSYSLFFNLLKEMIEELEEFRTKVQQNPKNKMSWDDVSSIDREMRRLKMTLSKDYYTKTLQKIDKANKDLRSITQQNIRLEPRRHQRNSQALFTNVRRIRRHANSLYNVFVTKQSWTCTCKAGHRASLRLETRHHSVYDVGVTGACKLRFRMNLLKAPVHPSDNRFHDWQEVEIEPEDTDSEEEHATAGANIEHTIEEVPYRTDKPKRARQVLVSMLDPVRLSRFCRLQKKRAEHHTSPLYPPTEQQNLQAPFPIAINSPIADICNAAFQDRVPGTKIGFLIEGNDAKTKHYLYFAQDSNDLTKTSAKPLDRILEDSRNSSRQIDLTRGDRLSIAVTLASSILQLDQTSWLDGPWRSSDVLLKTEAYEHGERFVRTAPGVIYPYISRRSSTGDSSKGKAIERAELKVPLIRNESLFALAQTLVELCFGKNLSKLRSPEDMDREGRESIVRLNTISRLLRHYDIDTKMGKWYADVVSRCLYCPFNVREVDLDNEEVVRAVYDEIVNPLVKGLEVFTGSPVLS